MTEVTKEKILKVLKNVTDPHTGISIVDMGFIYKVDVKDDRVKIKMTLTTPGCPMSQSFVKETEDAIRMTFDKVKDVEVELVFDPPWNPNLMSKEAKKKLGFG